MFPRMHASSFSSPSPTATATFLSPSQPQQPPQKQPHTSSIRLRPRWLMAWTRAALDTDAVGLLIASGVMEGSFARVPSEADGPCFFDGTEAKGEGELRQLLAEHRRQQQEGPAPFFSSVDASSSSSRLPSLFVVIMRGEKPYYSHTWRGILRQCELNEMPQPILQRKTQTLYNQVLEAHALNERFVGELEANYFRDPRNSGCMKDTTRRAPVPAMPLPLRQRDMQHRQMLFPSTLATGQPRRATNNNHHINDNDDATNSRSSSSSTRFFVPTPANRLNSRATTTTTTMTTSGASSPSFLLCEEEDSSSSHFFVSPAQSPALSAFSTASSSFSSLQYKTNDDEGARQAGGGALVLAVSSPAPSSFSSGNQQKKQEEVRPGDMVFAFLTRIGLKEAPPSMEDILGVIRGLIPMWVQTSAVFAPLLHSANSDGIAGLLPGSAQSSGTLELHRLALHREQLILRSCDLIREHCEEVGYGILDSSYNECVDFARLCLPPKKQKEESFFGCGEENEDCDVWRSVPASGGGRLGDAMRGLRAMRGGCLLRRYVVEDYLTWGLPIIARLFLLGVGGISSASQVSECVAKLNVMRRTAIAQDRQPLEVYLERLSEVLQYLEAVVQMHKTGGGPSSLPVFPSFVSVASASAKNLAETRRIVETRIRQQRGEMDDVLRVLRLKRSSVVNMQVSIHASICHAMQTDTFELNKTRHLFPSDHLQDAVYAPERFLGPDPASAAAASAGKAGGGGGGSPPPSPILHGLPGIARKRAVAGTVDDRQRDRGQPTKRSRLGVGSLVVVDEESAALFQAAMDHDERRTAHMLACAAKKRRANNGILIGDAEAFFVASGCCEKEGEGGGDDGGCGGDARQKGDNGVVVEAEAKEKEAVEEIVCPEEAANFVRSILKNNDDSDI